MLGYLFMGVGILLVLGSLLTDVIGIGSQPGFGRLQGIVMLAGGAIGIIGFVRNR